MTRTTYLCRRCATAFAGDESIIEPEALLTMRMSAANESFRLCVHDCGQGCFGLADLTGAIPDPMPLSEFAKLVEKP